MVRPRQRRMTKLMRRHYANQAQAARRYPPGIEYGIFPTAVKYSHARSNAFRLAAPLNGWLVIQPCSLPLHRATRRSDMLIPMLSWTPGERLTVRIEALQATTQCLVVVRGTESVLYRAMGRPAQQPFMPQNSRSDHISRTIQACCSNCYFRFSSECQAMLRPGSLHIPKGLQSSLRVSAKAFRSPTNK